MSTIILVGLVLASGLWLVGLSCWENQHVDFAERIAPQMKSQEIRRRESPVEATDLSMLGGFKELLAPFASSAAGKVLQKADTKSLEKRLVQSGTGLTVTDFRSEQVLWAIAALLVSACVLGLGVVQGNVSLVGALLLVLACTCFGFFARDWWLGQTIAKREKAMLMEFPALAELMALSVTAGESAVGALERVCRCSEGELAQEFQKILAQTRSGDSLVAALQSFSHRTSVPSLSRFVDGIVVAIERGTPLSDVLRAQAQDVRDNAKRNLMETAGKKEIAMMAPIIFCILPLTVVFAIFPGISLINMNF